MKLETMHSRGWIFLFALVALCGLLACEKSDDSPEIERYIPTDADRARCAHIDQEAELGGYIYNLCLVNPWPTELPEVEVGRDPLLAAWINDTLAFMAYNPRESMRFNIKCSRNLSEGTITIEGQRSTYPLIDNSYLSFLLTLNNDLSIREGNLSRFTISNHPLNGFYNVQTALSSIDFRSSTGYASGTFSLTLIDNTTDKTLTLTNGRFHAPFGG